MGKQKRARGWAAAPKRGNKDTKYEERKIAQWTARLKEKAGATAGAAATTTVALSKRKQRCTSPGEAPERKTAAEEAEQRVVIAWHYRRLNSPPEDAWDRANGTVAEIRRRMELAQRCAGALNAEALRPPPHTQG